MVSLLQRSLCFFDHPKKFAWVHFGSPGNLKFTHPWRFRPRLAETAQRTTGTSSLPYCSCTSSASALWTGGVPTGFGSFARICYDNLWWSMMISNILKSHVDPLGPLGMELDFGSASACCYYITVNYWFQFRTPLTRWKYAIVWSVKQLIISRVIPAMKLTCQKLHYIDLYHVVIQETEPLHRCVSA